MQQRGIIISADGPILELRKLRKAYGGVTVVDDVSVSLGAGEFMSFLGPSGSGKTTTLSMIAGLTEPSGGEILLQSRPLVPLPPYKRNIGVVFQNYALFPHMSVAANIAFPLEMRRRSRGEIRDRVARALDLVELVGFDARLPSQLSGGQQQRVALARAMVFEPPLLLMDEPLGALDKQLREQMQIEIKHLHQRVGVSVIYVTHDQDEALTMSDRIAVFNRGRIEQIGTPADLYDRPLTRFVAGFVGETNLLPGMVSSIEAGFCQITCGAHCFRARQALDLRVGQQVSLAIRPERITVSASQEGGSNTVEGRVIESVYLGRSRKYIVQAGDLQITAALSIKANEGPVFAPGDRVQLRWTDDDATPVA